MQSNDADVNKMAIECLLVMRDYPDTEDKLLACYIVTRKILFFLRAIKKMKEEEIQQIIDRFHIRLKKEISESYPKDANKS